MPGSPSMAWVLFMFDGLGLGFGVVGLGFKL